MKLTVHRLFLSSAIVINYNHFLFFLYISMRYSISQMTQKMMSHVIDFNTIHYFLLSIKPKEVAILIFPFMLLSSQNFTKGLYSQS